MQREKKFTKIQQKAFLQQAYPNGHFYAETPTSFCWKYSVQPSSLSGTYQFKICYKEGKHVDVFALDSYLCVKEKKDCHMFIILISSISVSTIVHQKNGMLRTK